MRRHVSFLLVLAAALALVLAACGDGGVDVGSGSGSGGSQTTAPSVEEDQAQLLTCGEGLPFPIAALDGPTGAEEADTPAAEHLREVIAQRAGPVEEDGIATSGWRLLAQNQYGVTFGAGEPASMSMATIWHENGVWDNGPAGRCHLERYQEGYDTGDWKLLGPLDRSSRTFTFLVTEAACASGKPPGERLQPADVAQNDDAVVVTFWIKTQTGAFDCQGGVRPTPVEVTLDEPLGDRALLDGGPWPAVPFEPAPGSQSIDTTPATSIPASTTVAAVVEGEPPADREAAEAEIDRAFHLAFDAGHTDEERFGVVEDGPALLPAGRAAAAKYPEAAKSITVTVHRIVFRDPTHAAVNFELFYDDAMLLGPQNGEALLLDGHWKVSRGTRCAIIEQAGVSCP